MPCWYFEKKEIKNSPSYRDGIDSATEARYRKEGAIFIVEAGTKLGLRYDTCATGAVYYHRFYMLHSFKEFPRYVTAACCLFLAGKVEETPKKCKDIIKIAQQLLKAKQFAVFGSDPKEEVMTVERVLLQTIKFDLQASHPYAFLLKYAKYLKADKEKTQKLVQMAWTFINDSLYTTLCLQWEPEIIAVSLMYLATRLNKFEISDWLGRIPGSKQKWWETFVEDITVDLMEDVCHQVLDVYSPSSQAATDTGESPPPPPPQPNNASRTPNSQGSDRKRSLQSTPSDPLTPGSQSNKSLKLGSQNRKTTPQKNPSKSQDTAASRQTSKPPVKTADQNQSKPVTQVPVPSSVGGTNISQEMYTSAAGAQPPPATSYAQAPSTQYPASTTDFTQYNPYISSKQYGSSFMSQEGIQNIQNMMGSQAAPNSSQTQPQYTNYNQPPPPVPAAPPGAPQVPPQYGVPGTSQYPPGYNPTQYPASAAAPGPPIQQFPQQPVQQQTQQQFQGTAYPQYASYSNYQQPPPQQPPYDQQQQTAQPTHYPGSGAYPGAQAGQRPRHSHNTNRQPPPRPGSSALTTVRITGR